jgi:RNA polymerase sigma-B factor
VLEALAAADAYRTLSLDEPLGEGLEALDAIGGDDLGFERVEQRYLLRPGPDPPARRASARSCTCASTRA